MAERWMIYGAYGYTGKMTVERAVERGLQPVVAGRDADKTAALAAKYGLDHRVFALDDGQATRQAVGDMRLVLHCAGPFSATAEPMMRACLAEHTHYLDITGEIDVFALGHSLDRQARHEDVVIIPGVGFDVVPTDCLAATLATELPSAIQLCLAFEAGGGPSPGTAKTSVEGLGKGGRVRRDGELVSVPLAYKSRSVPFPNGERTAATIPWGDVYTAYVSTGIPNIEVYLSMPPATIKRLRRLRKFQPILGWGMVQRFLKGRIERKIAGPSERTREQTGCQIWGEAVAADGRRISGTMLTPNGYEVTVLGSLGIVERLLADTVEGGYYTPSLLMGADYAASLSGVSVSLNS